MAEDTVRRGDTDPDATGVPKRDADAREAAEAKAHATSAAAERAAEGKTPADAADDTASVGEDDPIQQLLRHFSLPG